MSTLIVCRVCLSTDAPLRVITGSPLQDVYENLTEVSLNTPLRPVAACYVCYARLWKCHNLMVRAVRADKVLTDILQSGAGVEQEFVAAIKRYQLCDGLCVTPTKLFPITGTEHGLIKDVIKEEPPSSQCNEEVNADVQTLEEHFKFEESEYEGTIERAVLEDMDDKGEELITKEGVKLEVLEGHMDIEEQELMVEEHVNFEFEEMQEIITNELTNEENTSEKALQRAQVIEGKKLKGVAPAEECKETHVSMIQDGRALASHGNNVLEKRRLCRTVMPEDAINKRFISYTLRGGKKPAKISQVSTGTSVYYDNVIKQNYVLKSKLILHTGKKQFKCGVCNVRFTKKNSLKIHSVTHTDEKTFECDRCKYRFNKKETLKKHLMIHTDEKSFECDICKVRFTRKHSLKRHLMTHTGQKRFECDICNVRFSRINNLKDHLITHTGQKPFECEICKLRFTQKSSLKTHVMTHTGEKPFECEICNIRFTTKGKLNTHSMRHTGQKPFECDVCKVRFSRKAVMKSHSMTHTGQKPFECDICNVRFTTKCYLKSHLMRHTGQKPFKCEICEVRFTVKGSLKRHSMTHTGPKPFECDICKVRFTEKRGLKRHSMTHTGQKPFECDICKIRYKQKRSLKRHLMTHTGQKRNCDISANGSFS